MVKSWTPS